MLYWPFRTRETGGGDGSLRVIPVPRVTRPTSPGFDPGTEGEGRGSDSAEMDGDDVDTGRVDGCLFYH